MSIIPICGLNFMVIAPTSFMVSQTDGNLPLEPLSATVPKSCATNESVNGGRTTSGWNRTGRLICSSAPTVHVNVTANPTAAWVWRQLIQATPWGNKRRHLLRNRDAVYGRDFRQRARRISIDAVATPVRSPRANAIAERVIGTLRRECLDHLVVLNEQHLRSVLTEFVPITTRTGRIARSACRHPSRGRAQ
jgi:hypothetical protein